MKNYVQPSIQATEVALLTVVCNGSITLDIQGGTSGSDAGMAPTRGFSGDQQSLKYLI